jgi:hypothetical protein
MIPDDETETRHLARRAKGYQIRNDELYRLSASGVLQWCIPAEEGKELLLDTHEGVCGHHASTRSMVGKAFQQGFYWPRAASNVAQIVTSYRGCQYFMRQTHVPAHEL